MERTLWCFGDSFTAGVGTVYGIADIRGNKDWWNEETHRNYVWGVQLAQQLGISLDNYENHGLPGCSNSHILDQMLNNLSNIKKDDIVIIGLTDLCRYEHIPQNNHSTPLNFSTIHHLNEWYKDYDNYPKEERDIPHHLYDLTKDEIKVLTDYYQTFLFTHIERHGEHKVQHIRNLTQYLHNNIQAQTLLWTTDCWHYPSKRHLFDTHKDLLDEQLLIEADLGWGLKPYKSNILQTLNEWSGGMVMDGHWSCNGNKLFACMLNFALAEHVTEFKIEHLARYSYEIELYPEDYIEYPEEIISLEERKKIRESASG